MYFLRWPFGVVPEDSPTVWADRDELKENLEKLLITAKERQRSVMLGMWGYVGAGKSHTLLYFKNVFENQHKTFVVYSPIPKQIRSFADIYRQAFFRNLNFVQFANAAGSVYSKHSHMKDYELIEIFSRKITGNWLDMSQAMLKLGMAVASGGPLNPYISLINSWLGGVRLSKGDLRQLGLSANLTYDSDFVKAATTIIRMLTFSDAQSNGYPMVLWMVDDCHYLAELRRQSKTYVGIQQGLRDLFDACPNNLCVIFAFASGQASALEDLIITDLLSRIQDKVHVAPLNKNEALKFIKDLFLNKQFRSTNAKGDYYPFNPESARFLVDSLTGVADLTPRNLMKSLAFMVGKAEESIHPKIIEAAFVKDNLEGCKEILMKSETEE